MNFVDLELLGGGLYWAFVKGISYQRLEEVKHDGWFFEGLKMRWKLLAWSNVNIRFLQTLDIVK